MNDLLERLGSDLTNCFVCRWKDESFLDFLKKQMTENGIVGLKNAILDANPDEKCHKCIVMILNALPVEFTCKTVFFLNGYIENLQKIEFQLDKEGKIIVLLDCGCAHSCEHCEEAKKPFINWKDFLDVF